MGLISSEKIQNSFLFKLEQRANRERCKAFIALHAPADDRPLQELMHAEHVLRDIIETMDRHHDDADYVARCEEHLNEAVDCVQDLLAMWEPHTPQYDLFYFHQRKDDENGRRH
jgi:hypothetical protein